jgi:DNA-binding MarR family transcriptional regulator
MRLEEALQQKSWRSEQQKASLNIMYTASWITGKINQILKPFGISHQQFNILRILKGQKGNAATIKLLSERMIDKMSNTSRLVEKLKQKGFITREECESDRRRVDILITEEGLKITEICSAAIRSEIEEGLPLSEEEAETLNHLLEKLRS